MAISYTFFTTLVKTVDPGFVANRGMPHSGAEGHCNELKPNVFRFRAGSGRQLARSVLGEGGA